MPELSCEHPSREELQSYLNEHWESTREGIDYLRNEFGIDFENLSAKFYEVTLNSLYRLNDFPRENQFWQNTNNKPTIYKLDEFCQLKLDENSKDILALWASLASSVKLGAPNRYWSEIIKELVEIGEMKTDMLIKLYLGEDITYDGNGEDLGDWLIELGLQNESKQTLNDLVNSKNEFISNWARTVLGRIENQ